MTIDVLTLVTIIATCLGGGFILGLFEGARQAKKAFRKQLGL